MALHPANQEYKDAVLSAPYEICIERARYFTESYKQTEGEHPAIRAARAFENLVEKCTVYLLDDEMIVGNRSSKMVGSVIPVERGEINTLLELELDFLSTRERQPYLISAPDRAELLGEILPYWRGKTMRDNKNRLWKKNGIYFRPALNPLSLRQRRKSLDIERLRKGSALPKFSITHAVKGGKELLYNNPALVTNVFDVQGHLILGLRNILAEGFSGVEQRARKRLDAARDEGDEQGARFLQAVIICCKAIRKLAHRYAEEAERIASKKRNKTERRRLLDIAYRCRRVPYNPPSDFHEALQALWLTEVGAFLAYGMTGIFAVGRLDQYLYPWYEADIKSGKLTESEAMRLIEELLIKFSYNLQLLPYLGKNTGNELGADSCAPTIGGVGPDGKDAVNDLSYAVLEAFANVKSLGNTFTIRLSKKSPREFWKQALAVYRRTSGAALFNDDVTIEALKECGYRESDACNYGVIGCVEPAGDGDSFPCTSGNDISLTAALEMALLDGKLRIMGRRIGPRTGNPLGFSSFRQLVIAYKKQMVFLIDLVTRAADLKDQAYMEGFPAPYVSATITGCIENATDVTHGGAKYNFGSVSGRGLGTAVDSLAAIKHFVYDRKELSMAELLEMLDTNFKGNEKWRVRLANKGPKYGRDEAYADSIAADVAAFFCNEVASRTTLRGGPYRPSFFSYGMHVAEGLFLGATANGRKAGEPVSNSFSPSNGAETAGPTAVFRSVSQINHKLISNGCALNMKFLPSLFEGEENLEKMVALVQGFFAEGGMEVQPNVVSNAMLRDAQKHPENYRDLAVRVSGYSALFTDLGRPLQDEIISRTEFGSL